MTILEPVVAAVFGIAILDEAIRANGIEWVLIGIAVAAMAVATVVLARRSAALEADPIPTKEA
jgi:threonine/homoserine efflux transporter RhtA